MDPLSLPRPARRRLFGPLPLRSLFLRSDCGNHHVFSNKTRRRCRLFVQCSRDMLFSKWGCVRRRYWSVTVQTQTIRLLTDLACTPNSIVSACCFDVCLPDRLLVLGCSLLTIAKGQACLSNGLCVSDPHSSSLARLHRGTCTDQQWKSGNCPKECTSTRRTSRIASTINILLGVDNNGVPVYSCNSTSTDEYCCFDNCECNSGFETFSFQGAPSDVYTLTIIGEDFTNTHVSTTAAATSTSGTSTGSSGPSAASATTTATSTSSSSPANSDDGSSSNATAVGVGVGVGVGGALLLAAAGLFFWRRKKRNDTESNAYAGSSKNPAEAASTEYYPPAQKYAYYSEELR